MYIYTGKPTIHGASQQTDRFRIASVRNLHNIFCTKNYYSLCSSYAAANYMHA